MTAGAAPDAPLVSAIVAVRDGARFIAAALRSVLGQTYAPVEAVVVDDGSSDPSADIAAQFTGVRVLRQAPQGVAVARNAAIAASRGELIAFLDADDLWPADKLELQVGHLLAHPEVDIVLGRQTLFAEPGAPMPEWLRREGGADGASASAQPLSLVTWRRVWDRVGPLSPGLLYADDTDWLLRAGELGLRIEMLERVVLHRRIHDANVTHDDAAHRRGLALALKGRIDRRRRRVGAG